MKRILGLVVISLFLISCGGRDSSDSYRDSNEYDNSSYMTNDEDESGDGLSSENGPCGLADGTYSASVEYYNENTDYEATYDLEVEVEDCELTVIYWPSGGWSDEDHITPAEIDEDGYVEVDGEEGRSYKVQIEK